MNEMKHQVVGKRGLHDRPINVYDKPDYLRGSAALWGVDKHKGRKIRKPLLVLGTGRSGTTFTAKALKVAAGLEVTHEKVGRDGTVSHYFVTDSDWYPMAPWDGWHQKEKMHVGERRSDFTFDLVVNITRDPRKTIPSMTKVFDSITWHFYVVNGFIPEHYRNSTLRAMHLWYNHTIASVGQAQLTFKLEAYAEAWPQFMALLGNDAPYPAHLKPMNKTGGYKKYEPITFADMAKHDAHLAKNIRTLARELGYTGD